MRRYNRTIMITAGCLAVLTGLALSRKTSLLLPGWLVILWPLAVLIKRRTGLSLLLVIFACFALGMWRGGIYQQNVSKLNALTNQKVNIVGRVTSDSINTDNAQIQFTVNIIHLINPYKTDLAGSFKINGYGERMVYRGDQVSISGKIFPTRGANQATIGYGQITKLSAGHNLFADLSRKFSAGMQSSLPEPMSSFGLGLLVGLRTVMPPDILAQLTVVGLVHIVAVSGYNLTILVRGVSRLKINSKYQKTAISLGLIFSFVMITGFSASIIRAALVSGLSLGAAYYGRRIKPMLLISFAAALTAFVNPFYVWGDLSWYLSFLAFFGILIVAPAIQARLFSKSPKLIVAVLLETLSAEIMTLPLIMMSFGQLSVVALLANLLIVPLVPFAMLLSAVSGLAGLLIPQLAGWFAWPAVLLLTYMLDVIKILAEVPSALINRSLSITMMLVFYAAVVVVVIVMRRRTKFKLSDVETILIK